MRDLIDNGQPHRNDLAGRMADNVVEAVVAYLAAPGIATAEQVTVLSAALQALATLAIAEQTQAINDRMELIFLATAPEFDEEEAPA